MVKQTIILGIAAFSGVLFMSTTTYAEEIDCVVDPANEACIVNTSDYDVMPINDASDDTMPINDTPDDDLPPVTSGEEDIIFAGEGSANPEESEEIIEETEVEEEPALWPMYLSLGTLGLAILVFIILSICSPKLKKK